MWQLDVARRESSLDHQRQMELQAEWKGVLALLRDALIVVMLALAVGEPATDGTLVPELTRLIGSAIP